MTPKECGLPIKFVLLFILVITYWFSLCYLTAKMARLKQAKEEAEKEIAEFRAQVEAEFQRKLAEVRVGTRICSV